MKTRLFKNLIWKLGGLLLSFALWFHLTTQHQYNQVLAAEIDYINMPAGLKLSPESLKFVNVDIIANGKQLMEMLYFEPVKLVIDLSKTKKAGQYSVELSREQLTIPSNIDNIRTSFIGLRTCDFELVNEQTIDVSPGH